MNFEKPEENKDQFSRERANRIIGIMFAVFISVGIVMSICYTLDLIPKAVEEEQGFVKKIENLFNSDDTDFSDADIEKANDCLQGGSAYFDEGNFEMAIWSFDSALSLYPEFADAYNSRGCAYFYSNGIDSAMRDFNKAIELNPDFHEAYGNRGRVYGMKKEYELAFQDYNKALELNPEYSETYTSRAVLYSIQGEYDDALRDNDKALELNPKDGRAIFNKAILYEDLDKYGEAVELYKKFIEVAEGLDKRIIPYAEKKIEELEKKIASSSSE
jgi:tetratricopeptide (TPR) repeat protein